MKGGLTSVSSSYSESPSYGRCGPNEAGGIQLAGSKEKDVSPCEAAYRELRRAQEVESDAINLLLARLSATVLREDEAPAPPASDPLRPVSEVHGWLAAAIEQANYNAYRIHNMLARLTV